MKYTRSVEVPRRQYWRIGGKGYRIWFVGIPYNLFIFLLYITAKIAIVKKPLAAKLIKNTARQYNYNKKKENNLY